MVGHCTLLLAYAMSGPVPVRSEEMVISCCLELLDVVFWVKWVGNDRGRQLVPNLTDHSAHACSICPVI